MKIFLTCVFSILFLMNELAVAVPLNSPVDGSKLTPVEVRDVALAIPAGGIVIVSEQHGYLPHHANQRTLLQELANAGAGHISVGMEFLTKPFQNFVDQFVTGGLTEADFLKAVEWSGDNFGNYRDQVLFPGTHGGKTLALNANRKLTSRISKVGIDGLTPEERAQLPVGFALGNAGYYERFQAVMAQHVPAAALKKYFEAQSVWDDTMAEVAADFLKQNPDQRLAIIVGDFHAIYGGGLPDRLKAHGVPSITTISQVNTSGLTEEEVQSELKVHEKYGPRADFIWIE